MDDPIERNARVRPEKATETAGVSPACKGVATHAIASICVTSTGDGAHDVYAANLIGRNAKA